ncbi:MAG TPA: nitroreductase family protein [Thermoleophilia bacterium]|nr:nitroreductase family protein [Thermoleophilia bacterium]
MTARELIDRRYSCRTYEDRPLAAADRAVLEAFLASRTRGPLGSAARFRLLAAAPDDASELRRLGTYGFIKGATAFLVGAVRKGPRDHEDYGCLMEEIVLEATRLGLGTCWLGGTFTRGTFTSRFGGVGRDETIPAVVSTGYPGEDGTERIRERTEGTRRFPPAELFFAEEWMEPLGEDPAALAAAADGYADALEAVRMAPSATNRQPWRIVRRGRDWHFYLARTKGYGRGSLGFRLLRIADLQRVDLGIAMCHFELVAREHGLAGAWTVADPGIALPAASIEYTATWRGEN